jgi:hypothetical protein
LELLSLATQARVELLGQIGIINARGNVAGLGRDRFSIDVLKNAEDVKYMSETSRAVYKIAKAIRDIWAKIRL